MLSLLNDKDMPMAERRAKIALIHDLEGYKISQRTAGQGPKRGLNLEDAKLMADLIATVLGEMIRGER